MENGPSTKDLGLSQADLGLKLKTEVKPSFLTRVKEVVIPTEMNKIRRATRLLENKINNDESLEFDETREKYTFLASELRNRLDSENERGKIDKDEYKSIRKRLFKIDFPTKAQENLMNELESWVRSPDFLDPNRKQDIIRKIGWKFNELTYAQRVRLNKFINNGEEYHRQKEWDERVETQRVLGERIQELTGTFTEKEAEIFGPYIEKLSFDGLRDLKFFRETLDNYRRSGGIQMSEKYQTTNGYDNPSSESRYVPGNVAQYNRLMDRIYNSDMPDPIKDHFSRQLSGQKRFH